MFLLFTARLSIKSMNTKIYQEIEFSIYFLYKFDLFALLTTHTYVFRDLDKIFMGQLVGNITVYKNMERKQNYVYTSY